MYLCVCVWERSHKGLLSRDIRFMSPHKCVSLARFLWNRWVLWENFLTLRFGFVKTGKLRNEFLYNCIFLPSPPGWHSPKLWLMIGRFPCMRRSLFEMRVIMITIEYTRLRHQNHWILGAFSDSFQPNVQTYCSVVKWSVSESFVWVQVKEVGETLKLEVKDRNDITKEMYNSSHNSERRE